METHASRIVLIGPEASGKTTLARELAEAFNLPWTPEAARLFAESSVEPLSSGTVDTIARLSMRLEDEILGAMPRAAEPRSGIAIVRDTDLVSTVVYARHYYGRVDDWIVAESRVRQGALYLLCAPDLPWLPDGVRDRPLHREALHRDFRDELASMNARVVDVTGAGAERRIAALEAVSSLLTSR